MIVCIVSLAESLGRALSYTDLTNKQRHVMYFLHCSSIHILDYYLMYECFCFQVIELNNIKYAQKKQQIANGGWGGQYFSEEFPVCDCGDHFLLHLQ